MSSQIEAFPLTWPAGWPRAKFRQRSKFKPGTFGQVRDGLYRELKRMGATRVVLSTNIKLRLDGIPYATFTRPSDPGVAVYFEYKKRPMVFACDRWDSIEDNVHAISKTIDALRGVERWGASDMMERAFTGFMALPAPVTMAHWTDVLGVDESEELAVIEAVYRERMKHLHPDAGGDHDEAAKLNKAIADARAAKRGAA